MIVWSFSLAGDLISGIFAVEELMAKMIRIKNGTMAFEKRRLRLRIVFMVLYLMKFHAKKIQKIAGLSEHPFPLGEPLAPTGKPSFYSKWPKNHYK
jgi:hypothetical protein